MDSPPGPRADLSAAQRIAIALGTAEPPPDDHTTTTAPEAAPAGNAPADPETVPGTPA